ncbi:MAG: AAA family ATPase [Henriciella sp.]|nr:AAA family ATPase [Henriciella sp.]
MADSLPIIQAPISPLSATQISGTVYVIDLVGFTALTQSQIAADPRAGTERVSQMITDLFGRLMSALADRDIRYGGFAGDALIAYQSFQSAPLAAGELQTLAANICHQTSPALSCRTAQAEGEFWVGTLDLDGDARPFVWGTAIGKAFASLTRDHADEDAPRENLADIPKAPKAALATASVADRWTIVIRALSSVACQDARPEQLQHLISRAHEICAAHAAEIDNVVQDEKGLLVIITLPPSQALQTTDRDALLKTLTTGRAPLVRAGEAESGHGTVFRYRPQIGDQTVIITIGQSINQAAKKVATPAPNANANLIAPAANLSPSHAPSFALIGRDTERQHLQAAYHSSRTKPHTAIVIGPAGIGKTRLLQNLCAETGGESVTAEVTPGSRHVPFGSAQDLAEACNLPASSVFDTDGQAQLTQRLPHLVIVENWQWCDDDSKRLIRRFQNEREHGLLLISSRTEITDIEADTRLQIESLNAARSDELIERLAPNQFSTALKHSVYDLTAGTPFWLVQAALHYADPSQATKHDSNLAGLEGLLSARARGLSPPAVTLWRLHCAWRWPLSFEHAQGLLDRFDIHIDDSHLAELQNLGWLIADDQGHRPAHDILADWGVADLPVSFEHDLHATIARSVARAKGSPSRIANHWQSAGKDLRAAVWYERAAKAADRAGAHGLTVVHLEQAEGLARDAKRQNPIRYLDRLALAATANWGVGKLRRAKQSLIQFDKVARTIANDADKRAALRRAATIQSEVGQFAGNSNMILTGIYRGWRNSDAAEDAYEIKARRQGFVYYTLALLKLPVNGRFQTLIEQAHTAGEYRSEALIGCAAATLKIKSCDWGEAERILTQCHQAIAQTDDRQMLGVVECLLGLNDLFRGHLSNAHDWFEKVANIGRDQDHHLFKVWGAYAKAEALFYEGQAAEAKSLAVEARQLAKGLGDHQSICIIEGLLAQLHIAEGANDLAFQHARNAMRFAAKLPPSNFSTLEGIAAPAQVGAALKRNGYRVADADRLMRAGRKALKTYAQVFELAQPRRFYVEGQMALANAAPKNAQRHFQKAKEKAAAFGMRHELTLAETALTQIEEPPYGATP